MSLKVLVHDHPRSIALATETHTLVFKHQPAENDVATPAATSKCVAEFLTIKSADLSAYRPLRTQGVAGTLGLINIEKDIFICVITQATPVATLRPGESVQRIAAVDFICLNSDRYDRIFGDDLSQYDPYDQPTDSHGSRDYHGLEYREEPTQHPYQALKQALGDGTFYYSTDFDLTNRLQSRASDDLAFNDVETLDHSFLWNGYMIDPLVQFRSRLGASDKKALDGSRILTSSIRGFVQSMTVPSGESPFRSTDSRLPSTITLISRLSCRRAGTRFNARGLDDDGNVANFVETETVYSFHSGISFSYAQIRGSVPVFWEQATGLLPHQQKIQITRSPEATQPAFDRHFESLELRYGTVHVLNLLSKTKVGEHDLSSRYMLHIQRCSLNQNLKGSHTADHALLQATDFDFHAETKGPGGYEAARTVHDLISAQAEGFAFFLSNKPAQQEESSSRRAGVILQQEGAFRTNCLDCLDRTNLVQNIISQMALQMFFSQNAASPSSSFWMRHSTLWADNGDALSRIYAGTGALKSSFTRHGKMSLAGALADARKSATRLYMNNFVDKNRQEVVDTLLGRMVGQSPVLLYDPINDFVNAELAKRASEYSTSMDIDIFVGTFNLNGKRYGLKENLSPWLWPKRLPEQKQPHLFAVGFQEIVELSPEQILSTDPARRQEWETAVSQALNRQAKTTGSDEYVMLRSGQLVGAALMVFVKSSHLKLVKNVEGTIKKTGMSGMAGNKGAVAIRLEFANTSICFVTAHLAAGFANYDERNADYKTISRGLRFQRGRSIEDHDSVIWLGDFNYRIGLGNERVRQYIESSDLSALFKNDQLNLQMVAGHAFPFYNESRITFFPTYKYNNGTDEYDTSEKARIPAWCDRILWKGSNLKQIDYDTAPLRFSDHRPVFGTFRCTVHKNDEVAKQNLSQEIYTHRRRDVQKVRLSSQSQSTNLIESFDDGTGKTSVSNQQALGSDRQKWWINGGLPARSRVADLHRDDVPNHERPPNPFTPSKAGDWIAREERDHQHNRAPLVQRKPAPPVPKKPMALASPPLQTSSPALSRSGTARSADTSEASPRSGIIDTGFLPPPRRMTGMSQQDNRTAPRQRAPRQMAETPNLVDQDDGEIQMVALRPLKPQ